MTALTRDIPSDAPPPPPILGQWSWPAICGNGVLEGGEGCDDGLVNGQQGCSEVCAVVEATWPVGAELGQWDRWTCDRAREPTPCRSSRCGGAESGAGCDRRHPAELALRVEGRVEPDSLVARLRVPFLGLDCGCEQASEPGVARAAPSTRRPARPRPSISCSPRARLLGWQSESEGCGPASQPCRLPDDAPFAAMAQVVSPRTGVHAVHRRHHFGRIVPAIGQRRGWLLVTGTRQSLSDAQGRQTTALVTVLEHVDSTLAPNWSWRVPEQVDLSALAPTAEGGVVATMIVRGPTTVGQQRFTGPGGGLVALDERGQLLWVRRLFEGPHRLPHRLAVEPTRGGRVAVAMRDTVAVRLERPYEYLSGMAWLEEGRLLILGTRDGTEIAGPWLLKGQPRIFRPGDTPSVIGVVEVIDPVSGQAWWTGEYGTASQGWEITPAVGSDGAVAFATYFFYDVPSAGEDRQQWPQRVVVLDGTSGSLRWTRVDRSPRRCGGLAFVGADPRSGGWVLAQARDCNGRGRWPSAYLVERTTASGERLSATLTGRPLAGHAGDRLGRHWRRGSTSSQ